MDRFSSFLGTSNLQKPIRPILHVRPNKTRWGLLGLKNRSKTYSFKWWVFSMMTYHGRIRIKEKFQLPSLSLSKALISWGTLGFSWTTHSKQLCGIRAKSQDGSFYFTHICKNHRFTSGQIYDSSGVKSGNVYTLWKATWTSTTWDLCFFFWLLWFLFFWVSSRPPLAEIFVFYVETWCGKCRKQDYFKWHLPPGK